jgi:hypothetical protein
MKMYLKTKWTLSKTKKLEFLDLAPCTLAPMTPLTSHVFVPPPANSNLHQRTWSLISTAITTASCTAVVGTYCANNELFVDE